MDIDGEVTITVTMKLPKVDSKWDENKELYKQTKFGKIDLMKVINAFNGESNGQH